MKQSVKRKLVILLTFTGIVKFLLTRRDRSPRAIREIPLDLAPSSSSPAATPDEVTDARPIWTAFLYWSKIDSIVIIFFFFLRAYHANHLLLARSLLLVVATLSVLFLKNQDQRKRSLLTAPLAGLATLLVLTILTTAAAGVSTTTNSADLIKLVAFGLAGSCLAAVVIAKLMKPSPLAESVAVGAAAISLGFVCIPGLRTFTEHLAIPPSSGSALLFAAGPRNRAITLNVTSPTAGNPAHEITFQVASGAGKGPIPWVLVTAGSARMTGITSTAHVVVRSITRPFSTLSQYMIQGGQVQLISGTSDAGSATSVDGTTLGGFSNSTSDRTAVTLPDCEMGYANEISPAIDAALIDTLGVKPTLRPSSYLTVNIYAGPFNTDETLTGAIPPPLSNSNYIGFVEWSSHTGVEVSYTTLNQDLADSSNNALFLIAFLLGVAGAGVLGSLQSVIRLYLSNDD